jgi:hypothetical protein
MASSRAYLWQAAFVAYCNGTPEEEISQVFSIPLDTLNDRMAFEGWRALRTKMPMAMTVTGDAQLPAKTEAKLAVINENRQKNLAVFTDLRDRLVEKLTAWRDGKLKVQKAFNFKGIITTHEADPGPGDWVNIATFAQTIAQGTYRALGDFQAQDKPGQDAIGGQLTAPAGPAITIIMPGAVAFPREARGVAEAKAGKVIDIGEVKPEDPKP